MPRLPRPKRRSPAHWREQSSYSMYPNPRSRFCISSFDVLLSSGMIFFFSFSSMWITNSSIDSYPAASEHCFTFSSRSPSIFILCEPNIISPEALINGAPRLALLKHRLPHHILRFSNPKFRQNSRRNISQRRSRRRNLPIAQNHSRHLRKIHAMIATPCICIVFENIGWERSQYRLPSRAIAAVIPNQRIGTRTRIRPLVRFARQIDARNHLRLIFWVAYLQKLLPNLPEQSITLTRIDNPFTLASTQIQIKPIQP